MYLMRRFIIHMTNISAIEKIKVNVHKKKCFKNLFNKKKDHNYFKNCLYRSFIK